MATIRGARRVPGPTIERALSTKERPTSFPTPRTPYAANAREIPLFRFIPRGPAAPDEELLTLYTLINLVTSVSGGPRGTTAK
jgi:hypothetical protein